MFEILSEQQEDENTEEYQPIYEDKTQVAITYYIEEGDDTIKIDVGVKDCSDENIIRLGDILNVILQDTGYIETVNMIQKEFAKKGLEEEGLKFLLMVGKQSKKYVNETAKEQKRSKPCISPSDIL